MTAPAAKGKGPAMPDERSPPAGQAKGLPPPAVCPALETARSLRERAGARSGASHQGTGHERQPTDKGKGSRSSNNGKGTAKGDASAGFGEPRRVLGVVRSLARAPILPIATLDDPPVLPLVAPRADRSRSPGLRRMGARFFETVDLTTGEP